MPCPCIIVLTIVQDCERPYETVRELNCVNIVYKSYGIELNKSRWAVCKPCKCPVNRVKSCLIVLGRNRPLLEPYNNRMKSFYKSCSNRDNPCLIEYIRALIVHTCATFEPKPYQLIPKHSWSSILVPVDLCITEYRVPNRVLCQTGFKNNFFLN